MEFKRTTQINKPDFKCEIQPFARPAPGMNALAHPLLQFRQAIGNHAFGRIIRTKLRIGQTGDGYEQEADRVAEQVIGMPEPEVSDKTETSDQRQDTLIQRLCPECEDELHRHPEEKENVQTKLVTEQGAPLIQRQDGPEEEEESIQTKPLSEVTSIIPRQGKFNKEATLVQTNRISGRSPHISPVLTSYIQEIKGEGQPLPLLSRRFFEPRFGRDFSHVHMHTDNKAARLAQSLNSKAFTVGNNIVFGDRQYAPEAAEGKRLLAHELVHVIQQDTRNSVSPSLIQCSISSGTLTSSTGGLSEEMLQQIARRLRRAMAGLGTDEEVIYSSFAGRTQNQVDAISRVYEELFHRNLLSDLRDELTESEMQRLAIFSPTATTSTAATSAGQAEALADIVAMQLKNAMEGLGTDEESIYAALSGRTVSERQAIQAAYRRLTGRTLESDLRDELSGSELTEAIMLLNQGMLAPEDEIYLAITGLGTDEPTLFRVLNSLSGDNSAISTMEENYRRKYGDLIADLRSDLTSSEYERAIRVLGPVIQDVAFEDCTTIVIPQVRSLIPIGIQKVERAISVLSRGWARMNTDERFKFNRFFDPSNSGEVDENFVQAVLQNYRLIREEFNDELTIECETSSSLCSLGRLYYTYWSNIHVCPYLTIETDTTRKARDLVHELAHNAMYSVDRAYFSPSSSQYQALTPTGPWSVNIPIIGPLIRLISRSDTLFNPDAYSWFAFQV